jgi:para-nitrobenzyl esterase
MAMAGLLLLAATASGAHADEPGLVRTDAGLLRGTVTETTRTFEGIPYAAPPVGDLRWRAPEPAEPWTGVRDATAPGSPCPQPGDTGNVTGSEDCLFLNVHAPATASGPMPVMVFVHGGGLNNGHGDMYDPVRIIERSDVVVVTVNYRLGALGFLAHPDLSDPFTGNFGLADQQAALGWVADNIEAFGGDPDNVTLWGQSGGGRTTCAQLAAPGAAGLFHKAIVQSAPCGNAVLGLEEAERRGTAHAAELGCDGADTVACLREADVADLVRLGLDGYQTLHRRAAELPWSPVAGTEALPLQPLTALRLGLAADVPLMHGGTGDEMRSMVYRSYDRVGKPVTAETYPGIVADLFGRSANAVLDRYPLSDHPTPSLALATLLTDYGGQLGICSQLPALDAAARHSPVYAYEFAEPAETSPGEFPFGAHHSADLRYFFDYPYATPPSGGQQRLAETMIDHWTGFARTGDPGGDWSAYRHRNAYSMSLDRTGMTDVARGHHCGFWTSRP